MTTHTRQQKCAAIGAALVLTVAAGTASAQNAPVTPIEIRGGTASFDVGTNVPALSVHGKSTAVEARGRIRPTAQGPQLEQIEASVPVNTLVTGMGLRDEHMRKYVFTTSDGQVPDLKFTADKAECSAGATATCQLTGQMWIRGAMRPFAMALKVTKAGDTFRAAGDTTVKLSTFGIERP